MPAQIAPPTRWRQLHAERRSRSGPIGKRRRAPGDDPALPGALNCHLDEEAFDFVAQGGRCLLHRFRGRQHGLRRLLIVDRRAGHFAQYRDDQLGAFGRAGHVLRNLAGRHALQRTASATVEV